VLPQR